MSGRLPIAQTSLLLLLALLSPGASGSFLFNNFQRATPTKSIKEYTAAQEDVALDVRLVIGKEKDRPQFGMNGLALQLTHDKPDYRHAKMPGVDGPRPELSGGIKSLLIKNLPRFITLQGAEKVELTNGCWEMVWKDGFPAGSVICGFDVPKGAKRNNMSLPPGKMYINFPVWTKTGLDECVAIRREKEVLADKYNKEKNEHLAKMEKTANPLMKALHYRNAFAAAEMVQFTGVRHMNEIPLDDVVPIESDLLLCSKGTVWRKDESFLGGEHALLGYATVSRNTQ